MELSDIFKRMKVAINEMAKRLSYEEFSSYDKVYRDYLSKFGVDAHVKEYEHLNNLLSDCPLFTD